jgi:carboxypeptidase C (cathepsin A)
MLKILTKLVLCFGLTLSFAAADVSALAQDSGADKEKAATPIPEPKKFTTSHTFNSGGASFKYTATAQDVFIKDGDGKTTATFFTISYTKDGVSDPTTRPITFVFNGGPGSASIWLHFGLVGPKIIDFPDDASDPGGAPYTLKDNPDSILRATDIVFVDPVGTGYSRALGEKKNTDFWGFDEDADSVAEFIRTFITMSGRWNSPKFILGESYGGIRAPLLAQRLQDNLNMALTGLILVSPALNMMTLPFIVQGNDLQYATHLPALARAAWYHHKIQGSYPDYDAFRKEVEAFASGEYLTALFQGDRLSEAEQDRIAGKLAAYTGLSKDYVLKSDLRIYAIRFLKELLRDQGESIGLLDARFTQDELNDVGEFPDGDPFGAKTSSIYVSLFQDYLKNALNVDYTQEYIPSNNQANQAWKRPRQDGAFSGYIDVTGALAQETKNNSKLRVFTLAGYDDATVSYYAIEYTMHHSGIDPSQMQFKVYPGGHMMYLYGPSRKEASDDIVAFIREQ